MNPLKKKFISISNLPESEKNKFYDIFEEIDFELIEISKDIIDMSEKD